MHKRRLPGFTIVELLIVVVIIAILASITIVAYNGIQARAKDSSQKAAVASVKKALEMYMADNGAYPDICGSDNVGCYITTPPASLTSALVPKYIPTVPVFPLTTDYVRGPGTSGTGSAYAIRSVYSTGACKTGNEVASGWWGSTVPIC